VLEQLIRLKARHAPAATETTVDEIQGWFLSEGRDLAWGELVRLLKDKAVDEGLGAYVQGRHGRQSRMRWSGQGQEAVYRVDSADPVALPAPPSSKGVEMLEIPTGSGRAILVLEGAITEQDIATIAIALRPLVQLGDDDRQLFPEAGEDEGMELLVDADEPGEANDEALDDASPIPVTSLSPSSRAYRSEALEAMVADAVGQIPARKWKHRSAVVSRYGLDGSGQKTLEETGQKFDVTRERIRQIQAGFIGSARQRFRSRARDAAAQWLREILEGPRRGTGFVSTSELGAIRLDPRMCDGWAQMALDIAFGDVARGIDEPLMTALADACMPRFDRFGVMGWLCNPDWPASELEEIAQWLQDLSRNPPRLPLALSPFADQLGKPLEMVEAVLASHPDFSTYAGYLLRGAGSAGQKRAVRAHLLAASLSMNGAPVSQHELWIAYRRCFEDIDPCSSNDLRVAISDERGAPHLFILDTNRSVYPLGFVSRHSDLDLAARFAAPSPEVLQGDTGRLHDWLATNGPSTREQIQAALGIPENSLTPMLAQRTSAMNVTPRHYWAAWRQQELAGWSWGASDLVEDDARDLVAARQCNDDPRQLYAGWTGLFERALCERAEREQWSCLSHLLWACDPEQWPVDSSERARWSEKRRGMAVAPPAMPTLPIINRLPDAERLLRILLSAVQSDVMTPVRANRITRPRGPRELINGALLAMLARVGALSNKADSFWSSHALGTDTRRWLALLEAEYVSAGNLSWTRGMARRLFEEALTSRAGGWSDSPEWTALLESLATEIGIPLPDTSAVAQSQLDLIDEAQGTALDAGVEASTADFDAADAEQVAHQVAEAGTAPTPAMAPLHPVETLIGLAQAGDSDAQYQLSQQLERGEGVPPNPQAALYWLRLAAASLHVRACVRLGAKLWHRELEANDPEARARGLVYLNVGTAKGHAEACYLVGMAYLRGDRVHRNPRAAINLLKRAARAGHPRAAFELAQVLRGKMESWVPDTLGLLRFAASRNVAEARELLARAEDEVSR
jgi:hypothetical protein